MALFACSQREGLDVASGICPTLRKGTLLSLSVYADVAYDHKGETDLLYNQLLFAFHTGRCAAET